MILQRITTYDVAAYFGLEMKNSGTVWLTAVRPEDKNPSLSIYKDSARGWVDRGSSTYPRGGDCIHFWMMKTGHDFKTSIQEMVEAFRLPVDAEDLRDDLQSMTRSAEKKRDRIRAVHGKAVQECRNLAEYNEKSSKIDDEDASMKYAERTAIFEAYSDAELTGDLTEDEHNTELMISAIRLYGGDSGRMDADRLEEELTGIKVENEKTEPNEIPDEDQWDEVKPEPPRFLWYPFVPHGKLTVISARGGAGKGMLACLLAARISRGHDFGDLESTKYDFHALNGAAHTCYFSRGEDTRTVIQTRFLDSGGDKKYFHVFTEENKGFDIFKLKLDNESEFERFRGIVHKYKAKLVILDTIDKFLNANENRKDEVQDALTKIQSFATAEDVSVLCILHDRKGGSGGNMADRVAGSREWTDVPRSVLHLDFDPEDPKAEKNRRNTNRRVIVPSKNNLAAWESLRAVRFIIDGPMGAGYGRFPTSDDGFGYESEVTADDYELADLRKTTVRAILMEKNRSKLTTEARSKPLRDAIQTEVKEMERAGQARRRYSYGEFEKKHGGKTVWGGELQRMKALEYVAPEFTENGVFITFHDTKERPIRGRDGSAGFEITVTNP